MYLVKFIWHRLHDAHTLQWILAPFGLSSLITGTLAFLEQLPISYVLTLGLVAGAATVVLATQLHDQLGKQTLFDVKTVENAPAAVLPKAPDLSAKYFYKLDVNILDLVHDKYRVSDRTFEECVINGPAILGFLRTTVEQPVFVVLKNGEFTVPVTQGRHIMGALLVKDCIFKKCQFRNIAVVAPVASLAVAAESS